MYKSFKRNKNSKRNSNKRNKNSKRNSNKRNKNSKRNSSKRNSNKRSFGKDHLTPGTRVKFENVNLSFFDNSDYLNIRPFYIKGKIVRCYDNGLCDVDIKPYTSKKSLKNPNPYIARIAKKDLIFKKDKKYKNGGKLPKFTLDNINIPSSKTEIKKRLFNNNSSSAHAMTGII